MKTFFKVLVAAALLATPLLVTQVIVDKQNARAAIALQTIGTCTPDQLVACVNQAINNVNNNVTTYGYSAVAFASLPACAAANVGQRAIINNGATSPVWNAAAAGTGAVFTPVLCAQTGASTFAWVNS